VDDNCRYVFSEGKVKLAFALSMILNPSNLPIQLDGSTCKLILTGRIFENGLVRVSCTT
jgi:hypothetical protein